MALLTSKRSPIEFAHAIELNPRKLSAPAQTWRRGNHVEISFGQLQDLPAGAARGNPTIAIERPISAVLPVMTAIAIALIVVPQFRKSREQALQE